MGNRELQKLCSGTADGRLYRLGKDLVAKFQYSKGKESWIWLVSPSGDLIRKENTIAEMLYRNDVSVPKPYGVFDLEKPEDEEWSEIWLPRKYPAFVMQFIDGTTPHPKYLSPSVQKKIDELQGKEIEKVRSLGFRTSDAEGWGNVLWVPSEERIYLVDFTRWELP